MLHNTTAITDASALALSIAPTQQHLKLAKQHHSEQGIALNNDPNNYQ